MSETQAASIIGLLTRDGFFERAKDVTGIDLELPQGPWIRMRTSAKNCPDLHEYLGWDLRAYRRLEALSALLDGDAAKAAEKFLAPLDRFVREWKRQAP